MEETLPALNPKTRQKEFGQANQGVKWLEDDEAIMENLRKRNKAADWKHYFELR